MSKPLVWYEPTDHPQDHEDDLLMALGIGGRYSISKPQKIGPRYLLWWPHDEFSWTGFDTLEAAQAAAENDWQARLADLAKHPSPPMSETHEGELETAISAAWDFVRPKLVELNKEKGPAGVWSNGYRAGWTAALRAPRKEPGAEPVGVVVENASSDHGPGIHWNGTAPTVGASLYLAPPPSPTPSVMEAELTAGKEAD